MISKRVKVKQIVFYTSTHTGQKQRKANVHKDFWKDHKSKKKVRATGSNMNKLKSYENNWRRVKQLQTGISPTPSVVLKSSKGPKHLI